MSIKAIRAEYTEIIRYVSDRGRISYHKARVILTSYSNVIQKALQKGDFVEIEGLIDISFTTRQVEIYRNIVFDKTKQVEAVIEDTGFDKFEVETALTLYLFRLRELGKLGYRVNIKGIGYIDLNQDGDEIFVNTRVSPVLEKPDICEYLLMSKDGSLYLDTLKKSQLRFKIDLSSEFEFPTRLMTAKDVKLELDYVDI